MKCLFTEKAVKMYNISNLITGSRNFEQVINRFYYAIHRIHKNPFLHFSLYSFVMYFRLPPVDSLNKLLCSEYVRCGEFVG